MIERDDLCIECGESIYFHKCKNLTPSDWEFVRTIARREQEMTPKERSDKAYETMQQTQELNRKLRIAGVSVREADIDDYKIEVDFLGRSLQALMDQVEKVIDLSENGQVQWGGSYEQYYKLKCLIETIRKNQ